MKRRDLPAGPFKAFISYRHVPVDARWANWLHEKLETYRLPKIVATERGLPRLLGRIAQDEKELASCPDLGEALRDLLGRAEWLIVVCSPRAQESEWITAEIEHFRTLGRGDRVLSLLIEGEPEEAFPTPLRTIEPLAADVRPRAGQSARTTRKLALLRLVARLAGCDFDELRRRDDERRWRRVLWSAVTGTLLLVVLAAVMLYATQQARAAKQSEGEAHVEQALQRGAGGDAAIWLTRLPPTFANGGRWARAIHAGLAWTLVEQTEVNTVGAIAWSPDGARFAWGDDEERLHVWDMTTGRHEIFGTVDPEYDHPIQRIVWSPDRNVLATIEWSGIVRVWDLRRSEALAVFDDLDRLGYDPGATFALAWSTDGARVAGAAGTGARVWDVASRQKVAEYHLPPDGEMSWSRELTLLSVSDAAEGVVFVPDAQTPVRVNGEEVRSVAVAAWAPDGERIAIGTLDDELRSGTWSSPRITLETRRASAPRRLGFREVNPRPSDDPSASMSSFGRLRRLAWSPVGDRVAYLNGGTPGWWERDSALELPYDNATTMTWSPDGERLAVGTETGDIHIWRLDGGENSPEAVFRGQAGAGTVSLSWSPDGRALASVTETGPVQIWDTATTIARTIHEPTTYRDNDRVRTLTFEGLSWSKAADVVAAWTANNDLAILRPNGKREILPARGFGQSAEFRSYSWSPDGASLAYVSESKSLTVFDTVRSTRRTLTPSVQGDPTGVAWSPDGTTIAVWTSEAPVQFWSPTGGATPKPIAGDSISAFAWSPDSREVAVGQWDGSVMIHSPGTGVKRSLRRASGKNYDAVRAIDWAPREELTLRMNGEAELWDPAGTRTAKFDDEAEVAWRPGTDELAIANTRQIDFLSLPDAKASRPSLRLDFHDLYHFNIAALAWSFDGRYLAATGERTTLRISDLTSGLSIALPGQSVSAVAWADDGTKLVSSGGDGTVRVWYVPWDSASVTDLVRRVPNLEIAEDGTVRTTRFIGIPWLKRGAAQ
ncbi:MAG TPA: toll/interleukin-1 receptor domain-containing protein [Thermoanaerobaculia bacterium]|nr:toll/interleukin-1 receptor domain-containing protein [Thermoanaerobaculia bacterium]